MNKQEIQKRSLKNGKPMGTYMSKQDIQQMVLRNGKPLDLDQFEWNERSRAFSSKESDLVLDFESIHGITFFLPTQNNYTFVTGSYCTFYTSDSCFFKTGDNCTFKTRFDCHFHTGDNCVIMTDGNSVINAGKECVCIRRDPFKRLDIPVNTKIILDNREITGYKLLDE